MPNGKLRLNLADLRLKSFETTESPTPARGTVQGMEQCGACTYCTMSEARLACYNNTCLNASQTDTGCPDSWNGTCDGSCYGTCYDPTCAYTCCGVCGNTCCGNCHATCCCC
ncbi:MAG TPA: hypothetical protein VFQ45_02590 [Longimicrobium sp.]|nr:hypothetical protein [Longimicrobium sp.]